MEKSFIRSVSQLIDRQVEKKLKQAGIVIAHGIGRVTGAGISTNAPVAQQQKITETLTTLSNDTRIIPNEIIQGFDLIATKPPSTRILLTNLIPVNGNTSSIAILNGRKVVIENDLLIELSQYLGSSKTLFIAYNDQVGLYINSSVPDMENYLIIGKVILNSESANIQDDYERGNFNGYIISAKDVFFNHNKRVDDESIFEFKNMMKRIFAEYVFGTLRLSDNLKIANDLGTIEINSNEIIMRTLAGKVATKWNKNGTFFYDVDENQIAAFGPSKNYVSAMELLSKNTFVIPDEQGVVRQKYGKLDDGSWGIEHFDANQNTLYKLNDVYAWFKGKYVNNRVLNITELSQIMNDFDADSILKEQTGTNKDKINIPFTTSNSAYNIVSDTKFAYCVGYNYELAKIRTDTLEVVKVSSFTPSDSKSITVNNPIYTEQSANYIFVGGKYNGSSPQTLYIFQFNKSDLSLVREIALPVLGDATDSVSSLKYWDGFLYVTAHGISAGNYYHIFKVNIETGEIAIHRTHTDEGLTALSIGYSSLYIYNNKLYVAMGYDTGTVEEVRLYYDISLSDLILQNYYSSGDLAGETLTPRIRGLFFNGNEFIAIAYKLAALTNNAFIFPIGFGTGIQTFILNNSATITRSYHFVHDGNYLWEINSFAGSILQLNGYSVYETVRDKVVGGLSDASIYITSALFYDTKYHWVINATNNELYRINIE